jgi:hypothetical protein
LLPNKFSSSNHVPILHLFRYWICRRQSWWHRQGRLHEQLHGKHTTCTEVRQDQAHNFSAIDLFQKQWNSKLMKYRCAGMEPRWEATSPGHWWTCSSSCQGTS